MSTNRRSSSSFGSYADGVIVRGMPLLTLYPGNVYWVDSNGGGSSKGTFASPVATLAEGLALCTASNGDIVCMKPGHAESSATAIAINKAGVALLGLGIGSLRPTFTGTGATDLFDVTANDVAIYNLIFKHTTANTTGSVNVGAEYTTISNCRFEQATTYGLQAVVIEYDSDDITVEDCEFYVLGEGPDSAIAIEKSTTSSPARLKILRNYFDGLNTTNSWDIGAIFCDGVATNILVADNIINFCKASVGGIQFTAATTGVLLSNMVGGGTIDQMIDEGSCSNFLNRQVDTTNETAQPWPVATAT